MIGGAFDGNAKRDRPSFHRNAHFVVTVMTTITIMTMLAMAVSVGVTRSWY